MNQRSSGILLHPTSLPGRFGVGDLGDEALDFLDWLEEAGQTYWQVLPLAPTGLGNSPYSALSAFAGNPLLISPARLVEDGLLSPSAVAEAPDLPSDRVDYHLAGEWKTGLLNESWRRFEDRASRELKRAFDEFVGAPEQAGWLEDWTLYSALKERFGGRAWHTWPRELRLREPSAQADARRDLSDEISYRRYLQFLFDRQWMGLKSEANRRGIRIFGDIPIYVALDSAEVWSRPQLFELDESGRPLKVAGVPPDYFSETGQLWGNPIYRWDRIAEEGYRWWIERIRANLRQVDLLRLDHFRGFAGYWEVDAAETTAIDGRWLDGPGIGLFRALEEALGELPLVAEDLGVITPDVDLLRETLDLPGMKVLQFGFGEIDSPHLPHHVSRRTVYYTGTHDNDTVRGWFERAADWERARALAYLGSDDSSIHWDMIRAVANSRAELALLPIQDVLGLGAEARLNTPGVGAGNWEWRLAHGQLATGPAERLRSMLELSGRLPVSPSDPAEASA